ncbi:MAG: rod shape-determining protein RodA [Candidatus Parcubacteria bacterium]|nr:rod shape-determining protein RodA [Candidatus Parcubacteria bacterium]
MKLNKLNFYLKKFDWLLFISICLLIILSIVLLYSTAIGSQSVQSILNFKKQIVFFILGIFLIFLMVFFIDYRALKRYNLFLYTIGIILLILVLIFWQRIMGTKIRGTTGWFNLGIFSFQPVELVKVFLIIYLSKFFSEKAKYIGQLKYFILSSLGVILVVILIALQPDFGSAVILFGLWLVLILLTGIKKSYLVFLSVILILTSVFLWFFLFQPYQKERVRVFLNPDLDPLGSGYNRSQAMIAIGSGKLLGKGLAFGSQSQLKFLPESQTDFIFAVLAEELGLAGIVLLLGLFTFLFSRMIKIAKRTKDNFALYLVISICTLWIIQIYINIGGNLGLLPITGITLPFLSYGGSSLLSNMILVGLLESIIIRGNVLSSEEKEFEI